MYRRVKRLSRGMQKLLDIVLAVFFATLILDVLLGVVSRYFFGSQVEWTEELACYLLIWTGLTGAAAAFARKAHLGLDVLVAAFPETSRRKTEFVSCLVCLAFTLIVFLYGGTRLTLHAFAVNRISPALQLPDGFIFLSLPVAGVFMAVFQFEQLLRACPRSVWGKKCHQCSAQRERRTPDQIRIRSETVFEPISPERETPSVEEGGAE